MLSEDDLQKIREVIKEEVQTEAEATRTELISETKLSRMEVDGRLIKMDKKLTSIEKRLGKTEKTSQQLFHI